MYITPTTVAKPKRLGLSRSVGPRTNPASTPKRTIIINHSEAPETPKTPLNTNTNACASKEKWNPPTSENTENLPLKSNGNENLSLKSNVNETPVSSKPNKGTYKLSLCKSTTEVLTRKRMLSQQSKLLIPKRLKLELKLDETQTEDPNSVSQIENCDIKPSSDDCGKTSGESESPSNESLQTEIDEIKKKISAIETSEKRSSEHERLRAKWQEAGRKAIEELEEKLNQDKDAILANYHIDPGLFELNSSE